MRCPFCGKHSETQVCPFCGMDKGLEDKIRHTADRYYREGYRTLASGDCYGAIQQLKKACHYDASNINTLNLLGLAYYRVGEIGEAYRMWNQSIQTDSREENRAYRYMKDLDEHESRKTSMAESIRLYNEALVQCQNDSLDYAVARLRKAVSLNKYYVRAELLLALCYIEQKRFRRAISVLKKVQHHDPMNPMLGRYRTLITRLAEGGQEDAEDQDVQDISEERSVQEELKEPDLIEIFGSSKKITIRNWHNTVSQIGMFIMGGLIMLAFCFTLFFPDQVDDLKGQVTDLNAENRALTADKEALQQELLSAQQLEYEHTQQETGYASQVKALQEELDALKEAGKIDASPIASAAAAYISGDSKECAMVYMAIDSEYLSESEMKLYELIRTNMSGMASASVYETGFQAYLDAQETDGTEQEDLFKEAIADLSMCAAFMEENSDVRFNAMYYLGRALYLYGDYENSVRVLESFMNLYTEQDELLSMAEEVYYNASAMLGSSPDDAADGDVDDVTDDTVDDTWDEDTDEGE